MFNPTKAHEKEIIKGQYKIRMGGRVPDNAVNLAYSHVTPLEPKENIQIADTSGFVLENVASENQADIRLWPDETFLLRDIQGQADVYSQTFLLTDTFKDGVPLYYAYRLRYLHYDRKGPDAYGHYQGEGIAIVDRDGNRVKDDKKYQIKLFPSNLPSFYTVEVFTNFQAKPGEDYKVIYNAVEILTNNERNIMTNHSERLNAQPSFKSVPDMFTILDTASDGKPIYYRTESADFGYTKIYAPNRPKKDTRKPVRFRYRIKVRVPLAGGDDWLFSPWIDGSVLNINSLTIEESHYFNGFVHLSEESAEEVLRHYLKDDPKALWLDTYPCEFFVESNNIDATVDVKPDGKEPVLATTTYDTGSILLPKDYSIIDDTPFIQFKVQFILRHKTTGVETVAGTTSDYRVRKTQGEVDIRTLTPTQLTYPSGYVAADYELFVDAVSPTSPITLSFWDTTTNQGWSPLPGTEIVSGMTITIKASTNYTQKLFTSSYSLRPADNAQIRALLPIATDSSENWFLRIKNGRFYRNYVDDNNLPQGYGYFIPEYYNQGFDDAYGMPYRLVENEKPQVVDDRIIKVRYTPLFLTTDDTTNKPNNVRVLVNEIEMEVKAWDSTAGTLELVGSVRESDNIDVRYYYQETALEYRGYFDKTEQKFIYLDLNPGAGHFATQWDTASGGYKDLPSFSLINKTIYLYLRPAGDMTNITTMYGEQIELDVTNKYEMKNALLRYYEPRIYAKYAGTVIKHVSDPMALPGDTTWDYVDTGYVSHEIIINNPQVLTNDYYAMDYEYIGNKYRFRNGTFQKNVLFHTYFEIQEANTLLLAKIQVRSNSTFENINLKDTRSRGGGLLESIGKQIIRDIEPEGLSYWDIGYWDGEPYQENAVIVVKLPRFILKEFGGRLTREQVEESVNKHLGLGVFYVIEYLAEPLSLLEVPQDLVIETKRLAEFKPPALPRPTFTLIVEG